jgi:prepilin-type N-terminal cleavage/methylation domain-containing protein
VTSANSRAFTLIEAIIVMIIVAMLSGLSVITYQYATANANNANAIQTLSALSLEAGSYYTTHSLWPPLDQMPNVDVAYTYVGASNVSTDYTQVSVNYDTVGNLLDLAAYDSATATCFFMTVAPPGSSAVPLRIFSTTLTCSAGTIVASGLTSGSGSPW